MSMSSRRILTATVAAIIAVLTGVLVGLLSARSSGCPVSAAASPTQAAAPSQAAAPARTATAGAGIEPVRPSAPATPDKAVAESAPACADRDSFEALPALAGLGGAGLAGLAVVVLMLVNGATAGGPEVQAPVVPSATPQPPGRGGRVEADRAALVRACIYVRDRITSKALADRLGAALQEAGVSVVEPAGERFDPARHEAGGATPSDDPGKVGMIAAVEVPGYSDRGRVLRAPVVTVYQTPAERSGPRHGKREDQ
jgi:hypothetical protein